jgi:hypothetical protein
VWATTPTPVHHLQHAANHSRPCPPPYFKRACSGRHTHVRHTSVDGFHQSLAHTLTRCGLAPQEELERAFTATVSVLVAATADTRTLPAVVAALISKAENAGVEPPEVFPLAAQVTAPWSTHRESDE